MLKLVEVKLAAPKTGTEENTGAILNNMRKAGVNLVVTILNYQENDAGRRP